MKANKLVFERAMAKLARELTRAMRQVAADIFDHEMDRVVAGILTNPHATAHAQRLHRTLIKRANRSTP